MDRSDLIALLKAQSVELGSFTLASGRQSSFYIDARRSTMSARGLELVGVLGLDAIREAAWDVELVGGLTLGADPVAYAIARESRARPPVLDAFTVRKEAKTHGSRRRIEGCFHAGAAVVIVEDVITTGQSALRAASVVEEAGGKVVGVMAVVDREEGGAGRIAEAGYDVRSLVGLGDLGVTGATS